MQAVVAPLPYQRNWVSLGNTMIPAEILLQGYRLGIFPMAMDDDSIEWFSPDRRGIIPLEAFHLPHAARRAWARKSFEVKINTAFCEVIRECARRDETWINDEIVVSYENLHSLGHAHSVEAWHKGKLAGGLYGVAIGGAFFGESMFHRVTDASKIALAGLVEHLNRQRFTLLDTQWLTAHLLQFGAVEISRAKYLALLDRALNLKRTFL
jgi:leucyl/phenylalanyl-tRNA---protein transferase